MPYLHDNKIYALQRILSPSDACFIEDDNTYRINKKRLVIEPLNAKYGVVKCFIMQYYAIFVNTYYKIVT